MSNVKDSSNENGVYPEESRAACRRVACLSISQDGKHTEPGLDVLSEALELVERATSSKHLVQQRQ